MPPRRKLSRPENPMSEKTETKAKKRPRGASKRKSRTRKTRPYPASSFEDAIPLAEAIQTHASGERVKRLTLLKQLEKSPTSSATKMLITNSSKYGLMKGSYVAEWLELTTLGKTATDPNATERQRLEARLQVAIKGDSRR
jgi:hypothetical protein